MENRKLELVRSILEVDNEADGAPGEEDGAALEAVKEAARARQLGIGYRPSGTPVLKQRFLERLRHTLHDIDHNEYLPLATFERRAADWRGLSVPSCLPGPDARHTRAVRVSRGPDPM